MNPLQSMKKKIAPLGIYNLDGALLLAELQAYAGELSALAAAWEELKREIFLPTAQSYGLSLREELCGPRREYLDAAARREMLARRFAVTQEDCRREDVERALRACGLEGSLQERPGQALYFNCLNTLDEFRTADEARAAAEEFLPAHLTVEFDMRASTWDVMDAWDQDFDTVDAKDLAWQEIDETGMEE